MCARLPLASIRICAGARHNAEPEPAVWTPKAPDITRFNAWLDDSPGDIYCGKGLLRIQPTYGHARIPPGRCASNHRTCGRNRSSFLFAHPDRKGISSLNLRVASVIALLNNRGEFK